MRGVSTLALVSLCLLLLLAPSVPAAEEENGKDLWDEVGIERIGPSDAPPFSIRGVDGKKVTLDDFKGKVVFLNFWATWCPPCKEELPAMEALHKKLADKGLAVVAMNDYEPRQKVLDFLAETPYTFTVLIDEEGGASERYRALVLPTTFIIDREGKVIGRAYGVRDWDSEMSIKLFGEILGI
ncbi:MAG: TlpA disulfide reductase family protein [Thermodesulfobacteriota bacterium]